MFDSCSAYHSSPHILFLSHCVPNPPDKGDRIRAYHLLARLAERYRVHLVCFAKRRSEVDAAYQLRDRCESVWVEYLPASAALTRAAIHFLAGRCLTTSFYESRSARTYIERLRSAVPIGATVVYSSAVAHYAPEDVPLVIDMVDVDSEKWHQYASVRQPKFLYALEAQRLRTTETILASHAENTYFCTAAEEALFRRFAPGARSSWMENGVDFEYFDPLTITTPPELAGRRFLVFLGAMDYYPNVDAVCWFAEQVFSELRRSVPDLEFFIVGRNPSAAVRRLASRAGIIVTGAVPDVRPYLAAARAMVAPLRVARGIQNKVLESLAMGKPVYGSSAVAATFGDRIPAGLSVCQSAPDFTNALTAAARISPTGDPEIRTAARQRFCWRTNLDPFLTQMETILVKQSISGVQCPAQSNPR